MFRTLDEIEIKDFRWWARSNFKPKIDRISPVWHPVVAHECQIILDEYNNNINRIAVEKAIISIKEGLEALKENYLPSGLNMSESLWAIKELSDSADVLISGYNKATINPTIKEDI